MDNKFNIYTESTKSKLHDPLFSYLVRNMSFYLSSKKEKHRQMNLDFSLNFCIWSYPKKNGENGHE